MNKRFKIIITDFIADGLEIEKATAGDAAEVIALNAAGEQELEGNIEDADAIIMYHTVSLTAKTIDRLNHCKLIVRAGVGIDNVDYLYARKCGIPVANIPDYGSEEVADTAIGMMLALTRGITFLNSCVRNGKGAWSYTHVKPLTRLRNSVLGIVGLGRIGTATALRGKALGMDVVFYDPFKPDGFDKALGIRRAESLQNLLEQARVLSLHCPLTPQTHHLINSKTLPSLPPGAYLINTARGSVVDTSAIPDAIASGRLSGAAFDVLEREPPVDDLLVEAWKNRQHPAYDRILINPHAAFYSEEGLQEIRVKGTHACLRALQGLEVRNVVNG
jgi:C-terminal binding protein